MFEPLPDDLAFALTRAAARLGPFGAVLFRSEVESTNDLALTLAAAGAPEGTSVLADVQRKGRGRRGHDWHSPPEAGLYLSVVARPEMLNGPPPVLTLGAGVAAVRAVTRITGLPVELKWPNDLVIGRPWRKLGGVLAETVSAGSRLDAVVIGLGLNIRPAPLPATVARRATSLEAELGRFVERAPLLTELLVELRTMLDRLHAGDRSFVTDQWRGFARRGLGGTVRWSDARGAHQGIARGIDDDGALIVSTHASDERVVAGEVIWEDGTHDR